MPVNVHGVADTALEDIGIRVHSLHETITVHSVQGFVVLLALAVKILSVEIHSLYLFDRGIMVPAVVVSVGEVLTFLHNLTVLTLLLQDGFLYDTIILLIKILFKPVSAQLRYMAVD